jgi:alpha-L-fucosidase
LRFTRGKDGAVYIIFLLDENEKLPEEIPVKGFIPAKGAKINVLGQTGTSLKWIPGEAFFKILIRESQSKAIPSKYAVVFKISQGSLK